MTLHSVIGFDQVQDWRVSRSGRIATDRKAVRRRGPGRVVLGSKPQLATAKKLVRWAGSKPQLATPKSSSFNGINRAYDADSGVYTGRGGSRAILTGRTRSCCFS